MLLFSVYKSLDEFMNKKCIHGIIFENSSVYSEHLKLFHSTTQYILYFLQVTTLRGLQSATRHHENNEQIVKSKILHLEKTPLSLNFLVCIEYLLWHTFLSLPLFETGSHFCFQPSHWLFERKPLHIPANTKVTDTVTETAFVKDTLFSPTHTHIWLITVKPWWNSWMIFDWLILKWF